VRSGGNAGTEGSGGSGEDLESDAGDAMDVGGDWVVGIVVGDDGLVGDIPDNDARNGLERGRIDTRKVTIPDISIAVVGSPSPSEKWRSPTERFAPGT